MKILITAWIISSTLASNILCTLQVRDPKCRYSVHLPEASWYTAYDVCASSNWTLATMKSLNEMYFIELVLEKVDALFEKYSNFRNLTGAWIGAFMRSSNNESMLQNCEHLNSEIPVMITGVSPGDMFCLYYNRIERIIVTENCSTAKMFICEKNDEDLEDCIIESSRAALRSKTPFNLCQGDTYNKKNSEPCDSICMKTKTCYTFTNIDGNCKLYEYKSDSTCSFGRFPLSTLKSKSLFRFNALDYPTSETKPLSSWCPEVTQEVIQEKIANIQRNLTVNRKETSQYIRTLTSAPDERRSSKNIGVVGAFVIGVVGGLFILSDCNNIMKGIQNSRVRASKQ